MVVLDIAQNCFNYQDDRVSQGEVETFNNLTHSLHVTDTSTTLSEIKSSLERVERMVSKLLSAPYKMASSKLQSALNELLCQDYKSAFDSLNKVIDLADQAFHYTAGKHLDMDSFRDITRGLRMAAFAKILKYSYSEEKKVFQPYFLLDENHRRLISRELERLGRRKLFIIIDMFYK